MADFVFNNVKGKVRYYTELPAANDAIIALILKNAGLEADGVLKDYDDIATLLAAANDEADFNNYVRKTITSGIVPTVDDTADRVDVDMNDILWTAAGNTGTAAGSGAGNNVTGKLIFAYDPDTTTGTDSTLIPLTAYDMVASTDGNDLQAVINAAGFVRFT